MPRRRKRSFIWIPPNLRSPSYTVVVTLKNGTNLDISNEIIQGSLIVTGTSILYGLDSCVFILSNKDGKYANTFSGGEVVKIDSDYSGGTTRVFKGKLNHPRFESDKTHKIRFYGRKAPELKGKRIKGSFNGVAKTLVTDIIDANFSSVLTYSNFTTNLGTSTETIDIQYNDFGINVIAQIFKQMGWDGRLDHDSSDVGTFDLEGFTKGTKENTDLALVHKQNKIRVNYFGVDTDKVFNNISVTGSNTGGSNIIRTEKDDDNITSLWQKDLEITDSRLTSMDAVSQRTLSELSNAVAEASNPVGNISSIGSEKIKAGYTNWISSQSDGLQGKFIIAKYNLIMSRTFQMNVDIQKPVRKSSDLFLDRIKAEEGIKTFDNVNDLKQTMNLSFDDSTDFTLSNLTIEDGILKVTSGQSSGTLTTRIFSFTDNLSQFDFSLENPVNFSTSSVKVSSDSGSTYVTGTTQKILTNLASSGNQIVLVITLDGSSAELSGLRIGLK